MKRCVLYLAIISLCVSYMFGGPAKGTADIKVVQVGRITKLDWNNGSVTVRGVELAEKQTGTPAIESPIYITEATSLSYQGSTITFIDLQVGDLISATGIPQGAGIRADRVQKYRSTAWAA